MLLRRTALWAYWWFSGQETIDMAIACGALKQSIPGDFAIISPSEIDHFINHNSSNRINR